MIEKHFRTRLRDRRGLAAVHYILMVLIVLVLLMFVVDGYMRHLQDIAMTYDCEEVDEAVACAKTQYLMDGAPGAVVYYYDAETKQVYTRRATGVHWSSRIGRRRPVPSVCRIAEMSVTERQSVASMTARRPRATMSRITGHSSTISART